MHKKIQKSFFLSEISASEYVALKCSIKKRILVIGSQCVKNCLKIFHVTKCEFFHLSDHHSVQLIW